MSTFESLYLFKRNRRSKYNKYGYFLKLFESVEDTRKTNVTRGKCVKTKSSKSNKILNSATLLSENNIRQRIKLISSMRNTWPMVVIRKYFNHSSNQNKLQSIPKIDTFLVLSKIQKCVNLWDGFFLSKIASNVQG